MNSKSTAKSRIPTATRKKEQLSDATTPKLHNKEPSKRETVNITLMPKTSTCELNVKTKTNSEIQIAKRNVEKKTTSENSAGASNNLKPKTQNKNISPKGIEYLSKGMVNLRKTPEIQELKTSSKLGGVGLCRVSKLTGEVSSSQATNSKDETKKKREDPARPMTAPKYSTVFNPLRRIQKLRRRSRTEHEINLGNTGSSSTRPLLKSVPVKETQNANHDKGAMKKSVLQECLAGNETCATLEKNVFPKETSTDSTKPLIRSKSTRVNRMLPLERKQPKPINSQSKPLKRSNTIHVFDSVPVRKSTTNLKKEKDKLGMEAGKSPGIEAENQLPSLAVGEDLLEVQVTPKRQMPHGGIPFKVKCTLKAKTGIFSSQSKK